MKVADFFCGAGGFSEGFRQNGFDIVFALDNWKPAIETHHLNHPKCNSVLMDILKLDSPEKIDKFIKGIIIMTKGKSGALISTKKFFYQIPCFPSKVVDRTGAGDSFASGFLTGIYFLEKKYPNLFEKKIYWKNPEVLFEPIRFALANSTLVIENFGAKTGILSYQKFKKMKRFKKLPIKIKKIK